MSCTGQKQRGGSKRGKSKLQLTKLKHAAYGPSDEHKKEHDVKPEASCQTQRGPWQPLQRRFAVTVRALPPEELQLL